MNRRSFLIFLLVVVLVLMTSCGTPSGSLTNLGDALGSSSGSEPATTSSGEQPASQPVVRVPLEPIEVAEGAEQFEVQITNTYIGQEWDSPFHIVGMVTNIGSQVLCGVQITFQIVDADNKSLIIDYTGASVPNVWHYLPTDILMPGDSAPFDFSFSLEEDPANYEVLVTGFSKYCMDYAQADVEIQNTYLVDGGDGTLYFTGEIANLENTWVWITAGLNGAAVDSGGTVLSAGGDSVYSSYYRHYLAPAGDSDGRDITPFFVQLPNPGTTDVTGSVYFNAQQYSAPANIFDIEVTNIYTNDYLLGSTHSVGWQINNGTVDCVSSVYGVGYDLEGKVISIGVDLNFYIFIPMGSRLPFDIGYTEIPNNTSQVDHYIILSEGCYPGVGPESALIFVPLQTNSEQIQKEGAEWTVTGDVVNSSDKNLRNIGMRVGVLDAQGNLVAMGEDSIFPTGERITPDEVVQYEVKIHLDPNVETSGYSTEAFVQGWYGKADEQP